MNRIDDKITCLVFRTNLQTHEDVESISATLNSIKGIIDWSVDLEDWEKVLRIEVVNINAQQIISFLKAQCVCIRQMET